MSDETVAIREPSQSARWGMLAVAMGLPTVGTWLYFVLLAGHPAMQAAYLASKVVQFSLPLAWVWFVERRRIRIAAPRSAGTAWGLLFGGGVALAMLAGYFGLFRTSTLALDAADLVQAKVYGAGIDTPGKFLGLAIFYCLIHSLAEEYYWRWFVFGQLRRVVVLSLAIGISSLAFAAHHVLVVASYFDQPLVVAALALGTAVGGAVWAWLYHRTGSLYGAWWSHLLIDAAIMIVGYDLVWGFAA